MIVAERRDRVRTLRVLGDVPDALAARQRLERELGPLTLAPAALRPGAILCVRRLRVRGRWQPQVEPVLARLLAGAAHPASEMVPADALAVHFRDEAELLACLARAATVGEDAWWWRGLFDAPASHALAVRELRHAPHAAPAALRSLAQTPALLEQFLRLMTDPECEQLASIIAAEHGVQQWPSREAAPSPALPIGARTRAAAARAQLESHRAALVMQRVREPAGALLALVILLECAPMLARNAAVLQQLRASGWVPAAPHATAQRATEVTAPRADARESRRHPVADPGAADAAERKAEVTAGSPGASEDDVVPTVPARASSHPLPHVPVADAVPLAARGDGTADPMYCASAFAGVFYLVNAAIALDLYGDFTQPLRPGIALPIGDFLALVGEHAGGPAIRSDPVWPVLASLAGRDAEQEPGASFLPPRALRRWLRALIRDVEQRLALALAIPPRRTLRYVCARAGEIALGDTRVDIRFSLAAHPLPIRLAGLDRNPGWVPAAGRIIEFHYQ